MFENWHLPCKTIGLKVKHITKQREVINYLDIFVYVSGDAADDVIKIKMLIDQFKSCHVQTYCCMKGNLVRSQSFKHHPDKWGFKEIRDEMIQNKVLVHVQKNKAKGAAFFF